MRQLRLSPPTKEDGLRGFQRSGWVLVDATYEPVNKLTNSIKSKVIERDYPLLRADLTTLMPDRSSPLILIKKNVCRLQCLSPIYSSRDGGLKPKSSFSVRSRWLSRRRSCGGIGQDSRATGAGNPERDPGRRRSPHGCRRIISFVMARTVSSNDLFPAARSRSRNSKSARSRGMCLSMTLAHFCTVSLDATTPPSCLAGTCAPSKL